MAIKPEGALSMHVGNASEELSRVLGANGGFCDLSQTNHQMRIESNTIGFVPSLVLTRDQRADLDNPV